MDFKPEHGVVGAVSVAISAAIHKVFDYFDNKDIVKMQTDIATLKTAHEACNITNQKSHDGFAEWLTNMQKSSDERHQQLVTQNNAIIHELGELTGTIKGMMNK